MTSVIHFPRKQRVNFEIAAEYREAIERQMNAPGASAEQRAAGEKLLQDLDGYTAVEAREEEFTLMTPLQYGAVVRHLRTNSARPAIACDLWAMLFRFLVPMTYEVLIDRKLFMEELGISSNELSRLLGELVKFGALRRERIEGTSRFRYKLNPHVASVHTPPGIRQREKAKWPKLVMMTTEKRQFRKDQPRGDI